MFSPVSSLLVLRANLVLRSLPGVREAKMRPIYTLLATVKTHEWSPASHRRLTDAGCVRNWNK